ncbi:MAG TPA: zinc ribbon domain-containing protein [Actinomycetes bacterium]|nr:zinc ribbon domain-containing protein [Actinomycetes bacterium]
MPGSAHEHPTAVDLDSPAIVFVQTVAHVDISLISPNTPEQGQIALTRNQYDVVLSSGSGFAVNPSGYIVTSADIVTPDRRPAEIYAVNHLFSEEYGSAAPLPTNEFEQHELAAGGRLNQRLQRCYQPNTTDSSGGCLVRTSLRVVVYPFVTSQESDGNLAAQVLTRRLTDSPNPEVAVLKVAANSMPTVKLTAFDVKTAAAPNGEIPGAVLGFTGIPGADQGLRTVNTHFAPKTGAAIEDDLKELVPLLEQGLRGGPIVAGGGTGVTEQQQQVIGFYPWNVAGPGSPAGAEASNPPRPTLVDGASIIAVLDAVGVEERRGPTDAAFEDALHSFNNQEFAGALPSLRRTLELYGGHFLAAANLETALAKQGTAADKTGQGSTRVNAQTSERDGNSSTIVWIGAALAAVALLGTLALMAVRQRRQPAPADVDASPEPASAAASMTGARTGPAGSAPAPRPPTESGTQGRPLPAGQPSSASGPSGQDRPGTGGVAVRPQRVSSDPLSARGQAAPAKAFCSSCGQRLAPNHRFCGWCGHQVE